MSKKHKTSPIASGKRRKKSRMVKRSRPKTLFDFPAEIRNDIYDIAIVPKFEDPRIDFRYPVQIGAPHDNFNLPKVPTPSLANVCKQLRYEVLPRFHGLYTLFLPWNFSPFAEFSEKWLDIFGESRVPLHRKFVLFLIPRCFSDLIIELGRGKVQVSIKRHLPRDDGKPEHRELMQKFVESQLQHGEAGKYLTVEGIRAIVKFAGEVGKK